MLPRLHCCYAWAACTVALLFASPAQAGCPNLCDVTAPPAVITPPLSCGSTLRVSVNDCRCGLELFLVNTCPEASITAVDFEFDGCSKAPSPYDPCTEVLPWGNATAIYPLSTVGETRKTLTLRDAAGNHTVEVSATVTGFREPGCTVSADATRGKPLAALAVVALAGLTLARRRWAR